MSVALTTRRALVGVAVLWLSSAGNAIAHGPFATTVDVYFQPGNTELVLNPTTFGLLISRDGGQSFRWVCEDAIGYTGTYYPRYAVGADGSIYATTFDGLKVSRDGGCTFEPVLGPAGSTLVADVQIGGDGRVWAVGEQGGVANDIYASADGETFVALGQVTETGWYLNLRVSPNDPQRVYATRLVPADSGADAGPAASARTELLRTDDGGAHWVQTSIADIEVGPGGRVHLAGVLSGSPEVVFAVAEGAAGDGDVIYRSTDLGESWTVALQTPYPLRAFVARADGATVIAGSRNYCPKQPDLPLLGDVEISTNRGVSWEPAASQPQMCCIGERSDGTLFACGENWEPDFFALGTSPDGAEWTKTMRFVELVGPLECPAGTAQAACATDSMGWPKLCKDFGICVDDDLDAGVHVQESDAGVDPPEQPGGCCDGGGGASTLGLVLVFFILGCRRRSAGRGR